jgi:hypothetical protein
MVDEYGMLVLRANGTKCSARSRSPNYSAVAERPAVTQSEARARL